MNFYLPSSKYSSIYVCPQLCPTYPPVVIVPRKISDDVLRKSAAFRQHGRFPILCYFYSDKKVINYETAFYRHVDTCQKPCQFQEVAVSLLKSNLSFADLSQLDKTSCPRRVDNKFR